MTLTTPFLSVEQAELANRLDAILPQTQCTKCGFDGCRPYAEAMAQGEADVNRCPPGGQAGIVALAQRLGVSEKPLDASRGEHGPLQLAVIDETHCIGCTLCIQACPVDAIVGANLRMHTVLPDRCTGCDLCVAPCPVDCIDMVPTQPERWWSPADADVARQAYEARRDRLARLETVAHSRRPDAADVAGAITGSAEPHPANHSAPFASDTAGVARANDPAEARRAAVAAALARARARRQKPAS